MNDAPFWFVWNSGGLPPTHKHETLDQAVIEATRLARSNRGETFIVLESVCAIRASDIQRVDLRPRTDESPF